MLPAKWCACVRVRPSVRVRVRLVLVTNALCFCEIGARFLNTVYINLRFKVLMEVGVRVRGHGVYLI
jgi:hypothetical protein